MFERVFKNIDDAIWKDSGCDSAIDYAGQTSWMLFLKWLDDYEKDKKAKSKLNNTKYNPTLSEEYSWSAWAVVRDSSGKIEFNKNLTGNDLIDFVNNKLFKYLASLQDSAQNENTIEYKIGIIFSKIKNEIQDGYILRDVLESIDELEFRSDEQKHELSVLYESKIQEMGNAGRSGGQYYTPRPLIKTIVKLINPKIGETIYDGASGSCGFLVEAFEHILQSKSLTTSELKKLKYETLYGKEKKNLAYIIGLMNMILHGIESPNISKGNTLEENIMDIQNKGRFDVILANPPFGGGEKKQIQENFPIKSAETSYLFIQHFIKKLKPGGRAGIIIKNTFLSNDDAKNLRKELLHTCNLHTILNLPQKVFTAGVKTVVLFFEKGTETKKIFYYDLNLNKNLGKTNPLKEEDLSEFVSLYSKNKATTNSWFEEISQIEKKNWDLSVVNPNVKEDIDSRSVEEILFEIENIKNQETEILKKLRNIL